MTFPLPEGTCRIVCRPAREAKRYSTTDFAIRASVSAVKRGEDACTLARLVAEAVGCPASRCDTRAVDEGLEAYGDAVTSLNTAFLDLIDTLIGTVGRADRDDGSITPSLLERIIRRLRAILRIAEVIEAIRSLLLAWDNFRSVELAFRKAVGELVNCLKGEADVREDGS